MAETVLNHSPKMSNQPSIERFDVETEENPTFWKNDTEFNEDNETIDLTRLSRKVLILNPKMDSEVKQQL